MVMAAIAFMVVIVICALFGKWLAPIDPDQQDLTLSVVGPSGDHLAGTDNIGRDILSRAVVGTWIAVAGPFVLAVGEVVLGAALGLLAGYVGGWVDTAIARYVDLMWSLPGLLVTIMIIGIAGGGYWGAVAVLIFLNASNDIRILRASALWQRGLPYIEAARVLGLPRRRIMARHVTPNMMPLVVTTFCLDFAGSLGTIAGLAYLGFGLTPGTPDWGTMIGENRYILFENPAASLLPTLLVAFTAISMSLIGNWLYDYIASRGRSR
jgi:ABC-type dipeptide/oligopeptide/nickel transport system permease subunit